MRDVKRLEKAAGMIHEKASRQGAKRRKDILPQRQARNTEKRKYYNGDGNRKNVFTKDNKGNEIVASASGLDSGTNQSDPKGT
jgi:hypothetical protein